MKDLVIHIGLGKTGTTALQSFFWNESEFLAKNDISYPRIAIVKDAQHLVYPSPIYRSGETVGLNELISHISSLKTSKVIISSELIASSNKKDIEIITNKLKKNFNVKIVVYLRRQDDMIEASYNQAVKKGFESIPLQSVLGSYIENTNYIEILEMWSKIVGQENVIVRVYCFSEFYKHDIRRDFMKAVFDLEIPSFYVFPSKDPNTRLGIAPLELKRILNVLVDNSLKLADFEKCLIEYELSIDKKNKANLLSYKERKDIFNMFSRENSIIAKKYLRNGSKTLFLDNHLVDNAIVNFKEFQAVIGYIFLKYPSLFRDLKRIKNANFKSENNYKKRHSTILHSYMKHLL